jgi:hypothetical protein
LKPFQAGGPAEAFEFFPGISLLDRKQGIDLVDFREPGQPDAQLGCIIVKKKALKIKVNEAQPRGHSIEPQHTADLPIPEMMQKQTRKIEVCRRQSFRQTVKSFDIGTWKNIRGLHFSVVAQPLQFR